MAKRTETIEPVSQSSSTEIQPTDPDPNAPNSLQVRLAHLEVVKLRRSGASYDEIQTQLGYAPDTARNIINAWLKSHVTEDLADVDVLRAQELARYDRITARLWLLIDPAEPDTRPNLKAVSEFLKVSKARREITGMDKAREDDGFGSAFRVNVNVHADLNSVEAVEHFQDLSRLVFQSLAGDSRVEEADFIDVESLDGEETAEDD